MISVKLHRQGTHEHSSSTATLRHGRKRSCVQGIVDFFETIWHAVWPCVDLKEESFDAFQGLLVCVTAPHVRFRGARAVEQKIK